MAKKQSSRAALVKIKKLVDSVLSQEPPKEKKKKGKKKKKR